MCGQMCEDRCTVVNKRNVCLRVDVCMWRKKRTKKRCVILLSVVLKRQMATGGGLCQCRVCLLLIRVTPVKASSCPVTRPSMYAKKESTALSLSLARTLKT